MKVNGEATLHAPLATVWAALNDPAVLVRTIPGCEQLESTGPDQYKMTVTAGVASIKGTYTGEVALTEKQEPNSFVMNASGAGGPGTVSTKVLVRLVEGADGATTLTYDADAIVGGVVAGVGQRMLAGVAKKMAGEFFKSVDAVLTGAAPAIPVPAAGTVAEQPGVFRAPASSAPTAGGAISVRSFMQGAVFGALIALAGVVVGGLLGRRDRH
jgi:carbon monoxide dehydrogenase subunit G